MKIGALGDVAFKVSDNGAKQILTDIKTKKSVNYAEHQLHGKQTILEFTGINPGELSFKCELSAFFSVNPMTAHQKLEDYMLQAKVIPFVLGTSVLGTKWVIESIEKDYTRTDNNGDVLSITENVTLKEYGGA